MVEYVIDGKTVSSPQWWVDYYKKPYLCKNRDNETHRCEFLFCPIRSHSFSFPMAWWKNKETCGHVRKEMQKEEQA